MITEISKFYIEGTGNPNADADINAGFAGMPTVYHDSVTKDIYNYFSTLTVGSRWRKPTITTNAYRELRFNAIRVNNPDYYELDIIVNTFGNSLPFEFTRDSDGFCTLYGEDSFDYPLTVQTSLIGSAAFEEELYQVSHLKTTTSSIVFTTSHIYHDINFPVEITNAGYQDIPYSVLEETGFSICIIMKDFV